MRRSDFIDDDITMIGLLTMITKVTAPVMTMSALVEVEDHTGTLMCSLMAAMLSNRISWSRTVVEVKADMFIEDALEVVL